MLHVKFPNEGAKLGDGEKKEDLTNRVSPLMEIEKCLHEERGQSWLPSELFPRHLPHCFLGPHAAASSVPLLSAEATLYAPPPWQNLLTLCQPVTVSILPGEGEQTFGSVSHLLCVCALPCTL